MRDERVLAVIPARLSAERFPGKPLHRILGRPMIEWVWRAARAAKRVDRVVVATEDPAIVEAARAFGAEAVLTATHRSGSDRVAEVAATSPASIVLNVQGDEPLLEPGAVDALVEALDRCPWAGVSTLVRRSVDSAAYADRNVVKAVVAPDGRVLYFSRAPIGADADGAFWRHLGLYGYRRDVLERFGRWEPSPWEAVEKLEQLRLLWHGVPFAAAATVADMHAVDVPGDVAIVERRLRETSLR
jgi:3-deoxy-manno-octulosonate cytidylyltransferase (CMP-KDO synthetase)